VHGWRHNAMGGDRDVKGFREFLADASADASNLARTGGDPCQASPADQSAGTRPKVAKTVGLFVGWRGRALEEPPIPVVSDLWAAFSFFDRKSTAERVAQGSVRELFGRLSALARYAPTDARMAAEPAPRQRPQARAELHTFVLGHSFGASLAYRALSQTLIQAFAEDLDLNPTGRDALVAQFVDMLVLINPAIEAARFEPIFRGARKRTETSCPDPQLVCAPPEYQPPVLAIFTSEGDGATRSAFPIGAFLSNFFERSETAKEGRAIRNTIGWNDDYLTHLLTPAERCGGDEAVPYGDGHAASTPPLLYRPPGWCWCFGEESPVRIAHQAKPAEPGEPPPYNGPLWNVRVDESIIKDHSDIWNPRFKQVLLKLFAGQPPSGRAASAAQMPAPASSKVSLAP
jgi:hypothetical protein